MQVYSLQYACKVDKASNNKEETKMTTTMNQNHFYTGNALRAYLETLNAVEYRVHTYDYFTGESSEDPVAQLFSIDDAVD